MGIHRDKQLPEFAAQTFEKWVEMKGLPSAPPEPAAKVAIFQTCTVNYYNTAPGKALLKVLACNECAIKCPAQNCCGMPALDSGDVAFAQQQARSNIDSLLPLVREGYKVAAINPSCSLMMRRDYPTLIGTPEAEAAIMATDCPLATIQIEQGTGVRQLNPIEIIARIRTRWPPAGGGTAADRRSGLNPNNQ